MCSGAGQSEGPDRWRLCRCSGVWGPKLHTRVSQGVSSLLCPLTLSQKEAGGGLYHILGEAVQERGEHSLFPPPKEIRKGEAEPSFPALPLISRVGGQNTLALVAW